MLPRLLPKCLVLDGGGSTALYHHNGTRYDPLGTEAVPIQGRTIFVIPNASGGGVDPGFNRRDVMRDVTVVHSDFQRIGGKF